MISLLKIADYLRINIISVSENNIKGKNMLLRVNYMKLKTKKKQKKSHSNEWIGEIIEFIVDIIIDIIFD